MFEPKKLNGFDQNVYDIDPDSIDDADDSTDNC
jgi:hypothetical protein